MKGRDSLPKINQIKEECEVKSHKKVEVEEKEVIPEESEEMKENEEIEEIKENKEIKEKKEFKEKEEIKEIDKLNKNLENFNRSQGKDLISSSWNDLNSMTSLTNDEQSPFLNAFKTFYQEKLDKFLENSAFKEYVHK